MNGAHPKTIEKGLKNQQHHQRKKNEEEKQQFSGCLWLKKPTKNVRFQNRLQHKIYMQFAIAPNDRISLKLKQDMRELLEREGRFSIIKIEHSITNLWLFQLFQDQKTKKKKKLKKKQNKIFFFG